MNCNLNLLFIIFQKKLFYCIKHKKCSLSLTQINKFELKKIPLLLIYRYSRNPKKTQLTQKALVHLYS